MGCLVRQNRRMDKVKSIHKVIGDNVRTLRKSGLHDHGSILKFAAWTGVPNGTIERIEKGLTDPQVSHLVKIAAKFPHLQVWHLFIPGLDPKNVPHAVGVLHEEKLYQDIATDFASRIASSAKRQARK